MHPDQVAIGGERGFGIDLFGHAVDDTIGESGHGAISRRSISSTMVSPGCGAAGAAPQTRSASARARSRIAAGTSKSWYTRSAWPSHRASRSGRRSEEHTSELQSLMRISYAVFCLKKKKQETDSPHTTDNYKQQNTIRSIT